MHVGAPLVAVPPCPLHFRLTPCGESNHSLLGPIATETDRLSRCHTVLGIATMFATVGSTEFSAVNAAVPALSTGVVTFMGFALLLGVCAKSAQVPLQAWLLDAMEGPTPVSALIHAATMVTAGVYLVVRAGEIYQYSQAASLAVVIIGTVTLLVGAWIGCAKDDIKKVLAGSTMSQIGYMVLAAGIGPAGYVLAIFHLVTHGFFKANMFLGAGSIMHGMNESVNMREFGALRKAMPWTFITFAAGYLAIIGFPGFAGFYSKDAIIEAAFERGWVFGLAALIGAGVTAFYMTRLMMMTFMGEKRWRDDQHPHESSPTMVTALVVLGILSVIGGLVLANGIATWLNPAVGGTAHDVPLVHLTPMTLITLLVVAAGVALGWWMFRDRIPTTRTNPGVAALIGDNAFYADTINDWVAVKPTHVLAETAALVDSVGITTAVDDGGRGFAGLGSALGKLQNGLARTYGLIMVVGAVVVAAILLVVNQMA
ncbi:NADH-quinone oxidoreductase subunit L [Corynebacterium pyruviciproducens]